MISGLLKCLRDRRGIVALRPKYITVMGGSHNANKIFNQSLLSSGSLHYFICILTGLK